MMLLWEKNKECCIEVKRSKINVHAFDKSFRKMVNSASGPKNR